MRDGAAPHPPSRGHPGGGVWRARARRESRASRPAAPAPLRASRSAPRPHAAAASAPPRPQALTCFPLPCRRAPAAGERGGGGVPPGRGQPTALGAGQGGGAAGAAAAAGWLCAASVGASRERGDGRGSSWQALCCAAALDMVPRRRPRAVASSSPPSAATDEFCATGDLTEARAAYRRLEWTTSSPSSSPVAEGRSSGRRPAGGGRARRQRRGVAERVACTRRPHRSTAPVGSLVETPDGVPGRSHGSVSGGSGQDSASGRPRGHARRPPTVPTATGRRVARAARPGAAPSARPVVYPRAAGAPSGGLHGGASAPWFARGHRDTPPPAPAAPSRHPHGGRGRGSAAADHPLRSPGIGSAHAVTPSPLCRSPVHPHASMGEVPLGVTGLFTRPWRPHSSGGEAACPCRAQRGPPRLAAPAPAARSRIDVKGGGVGAGLLTPPPPLRTVHLDALKKGRAPAHLVRKTRTSEGVP